MKDNYTHAHMAHMALGINIIPHFAPHGKCGQIKILPGQQSKAGVVSEKARRDAHVGVCCPQRSEGARMDHF